MGRRMLTILAIGLFAWLQVTVPSILADDPAKVLLNRDVEFSATDVLQGFEELSGRLDIPLEACYESDLEAISAGTTQTFYHNLGGDPSFYLVFVYGYNNYGYHQANYGTTLYYAFPYYRWAGLEWQQLTSTSITVHRAPDDDHVSVPENKRWDKVKIVILKIGIPAPRGIPYVSHRAKVFNLSPDQEVVYKHNLGGDPEDYMIYTYGYNSKGSHHTNYGTNAIQFIPTEKWVGFEWYELTSTSITLYRTENDDELSDLAKHWDSVILFMIHIDKDRFTPPYIPFQNAYKNEVVIYPGQELVLPHGLGGDSFWYLVHVYGHNIHGYHQANYGTNSFDPPYPFKWCGFEWQELTPYTIKLIRGADDSDPDIPFEKRWDMASVLLVRLF